MKRVSYASLTILITATLIGGCALFGKAAKEPHPLEGAWDYSIDTPQGVFSGVLAFTEVEDVLSGTITSEGQEFTLEDLMFEESTVSFTWDTGQYGVVSVSAAVDDDAFDGSLDAPSVGATGLSIKGTRQMAAE